MRLRLITEGYTFMVTKQPEPKVDGNKQQQYRRNPDGSQGAPMWTTQVLALNETEGGETIKVSTAGMKPEMTVATMVRPVGLEAIPWNRNGSHGVAYRAEELHVLSNGHEPAAGNGYDPGSDS
jgi:hypothetical protein